MEELTSEEQEIIEKAQHLENLKIHPGWKIIEDILNEELRSLQKTILNAVDWMDFIGIREKIKATEKMLKLLNKFAEESAYIREKKAISV